MGVTIHYFYDENGSPFAVYVGSAKYLYEKDLQGDIIGLIDTNGALVVKYSYDAWGKVTKTDVAQTTASATAMSNNHLLYRGYYYDSETGLYYLNSRYYDPEVGRFINADVFVSTGQGLHSSNMYAYCGNNPVNKSDSDGELAGWIISGIVGAIIGGASSAINDAIMGREVTVGSVVKGAAVGFVSGVVSSINPISFYDEVAAAASFVVTLVGSKMSGSSIGEAFYSATLAGIATYASKKLHASVLGEMSEGLQKEAGKTIISFFTSQEIELVGSVGRGVYKYAHPDQGNSSNVPVINTYRSYTKTIHGGGRWTCRAMAW
ncbi:MAG: hypothetical protein K5637_01005 [Lachnospiraceae bacterium]|nr:hypothetical protein [Lachnospiraceae bacterium]